MAGKTIKGITIEIGGDTTKLTEAMKKPVDSAKGLQTELKRVNSLLKYDPSNVDLLNQKQNILNKTIEETKEKLKILKDAQAQVQAQFEKGDITEEQYRDFQREIISTEQKLKSLEKEAKKFGDVFKQQCEAASEKTKKTGNDIEDIGKKVSKASAVAAGTLGLVGKTAIDFETAWTGVTKTVDGTDEQLEAVRQGILDLAETTASSSSDIAAISEAAGQLGIETDNIVGFTNAIVRLGDSTNLVGEEGAAQLAKFANVTKMSQTKFENLGSAIVDLGNNFATTEQDIVNMAMRLAGAGSQVGFSEGEILGLATALSSVGIEAEMGGSAISKAMVRIQNAVEMSISKLPDILQRTGLSLHDLQLMASNDSKGFKELAQGLDMTSKELTNIVNAGVDLENFSAVSGMSADQFKKAWKDDAAGALSSFIKGLGDTEQKGESAITMLSEMGLTEVRLRDSLLRAANAGDLFNNAIETGNKAFEENTALANESNKRYETTAAKFSQVKETLKNVAISLGETLLPVLSVIADKVKSLLQHFTNLSPVTQKIILVVAGIVAAAGPLLIVIGKFASAIGSIIKIFPLLKTAITAVKGAMVGLNTTMLANPIFLIIAAVAALIAIFVVLYNKCDWFREAVDKIWVKLKEGFNAVLDWFKQLPEKISAFVERVKLFFTETIPNAVKGFIENIKNFFKENWQALLLLIVNPFAGAFKLLYDNCEGFRNTINNFVEKIKLFFTETIPNAIQTVIQWFSDLPYKIGQAIGVIIGHIVLFVQNIWDFFTVKLPEYILIAIDWFKSLPERIWNAIVLTITNITNWCIEMGNKARTGISTIITNVTEWFKALPSKIWNAIILAVHYIANWCAKMKSKAVNGVTDLVNSVITWFKSLPTKISNAISNGINIISNWFTNMKNKAVSGVKSVADSVVNGFKALPSKMLDIGKNIVEGIWNGIQKAKKWMTDKIKEFANGVLDGIKSTLGIHSPSRVFRDQVGKFIAEGIGVGITENQNAPTEALKHVANSMLNETQSINGITLNRQIENTFSGNVSSNGAILEYLSDIVSKLDRKMQIVLDSGTIVGETTDLFSSAFGTKKMQASRGW